MGLRSALIDRASIRVGIALVKARLAFVEAGLAMRGYDERGQESYKEGFRELHGCQIWKSVMMNAVLVV